MGKNYISEHPGNSYYQWREALTVHALYFLSISTINCPRPMAGDEGIATSFLSVVRIPNNTKALNTKNTIPL